MPRLSGYVIRPDGTPAENATVVISHVNQFALADENGYFDLGNIPTGRYTIHVVHRAHPKMTLDYSHTGDTILEISMEA